MEILAQRIMEVLVNIPVPIALNLRLLTHGQVVLPMKVLQGVQRPILDRLALEDHIMYHDLIIHHLRLAAQQPIMNLQAPR